MTVMSTNLWLKCLENKYGTNDFRYKAVVSPCGDIRIGQKTLSIHKKSVTALSAGGVHQQIKDQLLVAGIHTLVDFVLVSEGDSDAGLQGQHVDGGGHTPFTPTMVVWSQLLKWLLLVRFSIDLEAVVL